ncbi:MAG: response regulator [Humidesulfovibrio sp.]|uniref:response regulator n=1 Tax=Humidesulfovibrio sp. TaxID=2910988 RepID=UPI0027348952|nr:response regulator [Humidesulfovibrio sp.]MDP2848207.1 response regulator [Humidesulfovibrio sp.]
MNTKDWKILLVDDEHEFITTLAERLELRGINARVVFDGESALLAVAQDEPHVMVLDVLMPGIKGLEVLERVKRSNPQVQVLLLTGHGSTRDGIEGMRLGAFDYMMKPLNIDTLIEKMESAIDYAGKAASLGQ